MHPLLLKGHERPLTRVKFNREGDVLFTAAMDKSPTCWSASTGARIGTYNGHNGAVQDLDIMWNTDRIITGSGDNSAILWRAENAEKLHEWKFRSPARAVAFGPGDTHIAIATANLMNQPSNVYVFRHDRDVAEQDSEPVVVLEGHTGTIIRVLWYPTGEYILTAARDKTVRKWDVKTGKQIAQVQAHSGDIQDCQWGPDSMTMITASKDHTAKLWSFHDFELLKTYSADHPINSAAVSPIFSHILLGGGQEASEVTTTGDRQGKFEGKLYHLVYEEEFGRVKGHFGPINTVAFSPDGRQYVSGGEDGFVRLHTFDSDYFEKGEQDSF